MSDFDIVEEALVECLNEEQLKSAIAIADMMMSMSDITPEHALSRAREYALARSRFWELEYSRLVGIRHEQSNHASEKSAGGPNVRRPIGFRSENDNTKL